MGFFSGNNYIIANGKKELTNEKPVFEYTSPKIIAIPLKNMGSEAFDVHVNVNDYVKIGTKIATRNDHFTLPIFSSVSGKVVAIEKRNHVSLKKTVHIVIENDFKEEKNQVFKSISDIHSISKEDITNYIKEYGVLGLGGAGFPTYVKYQDTKDISTVLINGVECEPYITADETIMKENANLLFEGTLLFMKACGASTGIIAIKKGKQVLFNTLLEYSKNYHNIQLKQVRDIYPMGWERMLIKEVLNKSYNKLPSEIGVIVDNSTTAIEFVRSIKTGLPMHQRIVTLSGDGINNPQNVKVKVGTLLNEVIEAIGGYNSQLPKNCRLVAGGPFMGKSIITDNLAITSSSNAFIVLIDAKTRESACLRCGACIDNCPVGLQPIQIVKAYKAKSSDMLKKLCSFKCIECGTCSFVCPSSIQVTEETRKAKAFSLSQI